MDEMVNKKEMTDKTRVIDEDGEVIIILENANAPFAVWSDGEQDVEIPQESETKNDETAKYEYRIQVSAKHLMLASPVFKKTLSGGWKESSTFVNKGSVEIKVDSWDIGAFVVFMRIIHCRLNAIPHKLSLELLSKITVLADYYGCLDIMSIFRDVWINQLRNDFPKSHCRDLLLWLWISWAFQDHDLFQKATLTAMAQSNGWITNLGLPIPDKIIDTMNDQRQSAICNIVDSLHQKKEDLIHGDCRPCNATSLGNLIMGMNSNGLLSPKPTTPFLGIGLCELEAKVRSFKAPPGHSHSCKYSGYGYGYSYGRHYGNSDSFDLLPERPSSTENGLELGAFQGS